MATSTAAQRREQAKRDYDAFLARCPTRELLSRLTDQWVPLAIPALAASVPVRVDYAPRARFDAPAPP
jgi:hypothetical protein